LKSQSDEAAREKKKTKKTKNIEPEDRLDYLRAKVTDPQGGDWSACLDISDSHFWTRSGGCNVEQVVHAINKQGMWMVDRDDVAAHKEVYEKGLHEALQGLYNIPNLIPVEVHDELVRRFEQLQVNPAPSLVGYDDAALAPGAAPMALVPVSTPGFAPGKKPPVMVAPVPWGDVDDALQKESERSWMLTKTGLKELGMLPPPPLPVSHKLTTPPVATADALLELRLAWKGVHPPNAATPAICGNSAAAWSATIAPIE
jgi:hypothetical protein